MKNLIIKFTAWYIKPLGYEVIQKDVLDEITHSLFRYEMMEFFDHFGVDIRCEPEPVREGNVIKVDFKV
jgi:hypothetical protein